MTSRARAISTRSYARPCYDTLATSAQAFRQTT